MFHSPLPDSLLDETDEKFISPDFLGKKWADELNVALCSPFYPADLFRIDWKYFRRLTSLASFPSDSLTPLARQFRDTTGLPFAGLSTKLARSTVLAYVYTLQINQLRKSCAGRDVEPIDEVSQMLGAAARARHGRTMIDMIQRKVEDFRSQRLLLGEGMILAKCLLNVLEIVSAMGEDFTGMITLRGCYHVKHLLSQKMAASSHLTRILFGWLSILNDRLVPALQEQWDHMEHARMQAVQKSQAVFGKHHWKTLTGINNLALTFIMQKRWKEAEKLLAPAMETGRRALRKGHSAKLNIMSNLAVIRYSQGQSEEAEKLFMEVMETRRKLLGKEHMVTLMSMDNLATMLMHQYRWKEAEELGKDGNFSVKNNGEEEKGRWRGKFGLMSSTGVMLVRPEFPDASHTVFLHPSSR